MHGLISNLIFIALISICFGELNSTESTIEPCERCSPCWNLFSKNYGPCSMEGYHFNPFDNDQPVCIDTLILLIIMFLMIVISIPTCLWIFYLWIKRCRNIDGKYVVNGRLIA